MYVPERMHITDDWLRQFYGQRARYSRDVRDRKGLFVRITVLGRVLFFARYSFGRSRHELIMGAFPMMGVEQARAERVKITEETQGGVDPAVTRSAVHSHTRCTETVEDLCWGMMDSWGPKYFYKKPDRIADYEAFVFPQIGRRSPASVTKKEWLAVLCNAYRANPGASFRLALGITDALELAEREGLMDRNPLAGFTAFDLRILAEIAADQGEATLLRALARWRT